MLPPRNKPLGGKYIDQSGQMLTPKQLEDRRKMAQALMAKGADFSPAGHWTEALGRAFNGWIGGKQAGQFNRQEEEATSAARSKMEGRYSASPVASALAGGGASVPPGGHSPGDGHDHSDVSAADWLKYTNQGAVRSKPIAASLVDAMSFLPEMGVSMEVYSGGQDAEGPNRTGSTRHDHGNAADVMFYDATGRMLDWNNPDDVATLQTIVSTAKSRGVTGFGAGDDYMGAGRMHIGFGNPGVWGAGGKGANAPAWLTEAYSGAVGTPSVATGQTSNDIYALMADPWVMDQYGSVLGSELAGVQQRENAIFSQQLAMQDPMYQLGLEQTQLEIEQMKRGSPDEYAQRASAAAMYGLQEGTPEFQNFVLTGDFAIAKPAEAQSAIAKLQADLNAGLITPEQYALGAEKLGGGNTVVNNNMGGDKFAEEVGKGQATAFQEMSSTGFTAAQTLGQLDRLEGLLSQGPTGASAAIQSLAGEYGIDFGNLGPLQAANALIQAMIPGQRPAGSGPMSDKDIEMFKASLPRLINSPEGNALIVQTLRGIAQYDVQRAEIADRAMLPPEDPMHLSRADAAKAIRGLQSPLSGFGKAASGFAAEAASVDSSLPPEGVDPEDWSYMSEEERALFR